jgi:hypothetical protein
VYVFPLGALIVRLVLLIAFTGPMKEMPPGLKATGDEPGVGDEDVVPGVVDVPDVAVAVVPGVDGPGLPLPTPEHAVIRSIMTRPAIDTSIPFFRIVSLRAFQKNLQAQISHTLYKKSGYLIDDDTSVFRGMVCAAGY